MCVNVCWCVLMSFVCSGLLSTYIWPLKRALHVLKRALLLQIKNRALLRKRRVLLDSYISLLMLLLHKAGELPTMSHEWREKEPYVYSKEPYMYSKETYMYFKAARLERKKSPIHTQKSLTRTQKSPMGTQKSPIHTQKSPMGTQKSPMGTQKSPIHTQKSLTRTQKSPTYSWMSHDFRADFWEILSADSMADNHDMDAAAQVMAVAQV